MVAYFVGLARQSLEIVGYGLVLAAQRQREVRIVGLRVTTRTFVHHEVSAAGFDRRLEALDRFDEVHEVFRALVAVEPNSQSRETTGKLVRDTPHIFIVSGTRVVWPSHG
jgi:hypothetical protein